MRPLLSFGPTPNAVKWSEYVRVFDIDTGTAWDLTDILIEMEVRDKNDCRRLYGTTTSGEIELEGEGFRFTFSRASMKQLCAGSYTTFIRFTENGSDEDAEPVIANLPIIDGGFR